MFQSIRSSEYYVSLPKALFTLGTSGGVKLWKLVLVLDFKNLQKSHKIIISISLESIRSSKYYVSVPEALFALGTLGGAKP